MRPHVELIQEDDYVWHAAELPGGEGRASERRLSVDEEDGSSSLRVDFHTDWGRGPGIHHANTEYYVLEGEIDYGGRTIGKGGYVYAPKGVPDRLPQGRRGHPAAALPRVRRRRLRPGRLAGRRHAPGPTLARTSSSSTPTRWSGTPCPTPARCPGLFIKYLHVDPVTGFYTRLVHAQEGWADHRLAHHPCYEEAYTTQGHMEYNFGTLDLGTYFFRPARVKHGHFTTMEGGATWLLRSDGELANWYTQNEWVRWGGEGVNYGPDGLDESPHPALPVVALDPRHGPAVADRRGHAPADRLVAVPEGPGPATTPRSRTTAPAPNRPTSRSPRRSTRSTCRAVTAAASTRHDHATTTGTTTTTTTTHEAPGLDWGWTGRDTEHADERTDAQRPQLGCRSGLEAGRPDPGAHPLLAAGPQPLARALGRRRDVTLFLKARASARSTASTATAPRCSCTSLLFVYWLGGDLGVYYSSRYILKPDSSPRPGRSRPRSCTASTWRPGSAWCCSCPAASR